MSAPVALLIDFGSTYTKLRAVDLTGGRLLAASQAPSTVETDAALGFSEALDALHRLLGEKTRFRYRLACSSAAGGLRLIAVGLVRELTAEAARRAALGAGAELIDTFAYELTRKNADRIVRLEPDIILLAGGTDGGNSEVIVANARTLADLPIRCPVLVAGNRSASHRINDLLTDAGKPVLVTENVMPSYGVLNVEPARDKIRRIFINRIVKAKGIDRARGTFDLVLMPTPAAVMEGARLLADGDGRRPGVGTLVVVDVGGATTDVHSICTGESTLGSVSADPLPEPRAKRTVEGDLGVRRSATSVLEAAGLEAVAADAGLPAVRVQSNVRALDAGQARLQDDIESRKVDHALARAAVRIAVGRHTGSVEAVRTVNGPAVVQRGKDLSDVDAVVGTGGALTVSEHPEEILEMALADSSDPFSLNPGRPRLMLDRKHVLYACGLLAAVDPEAALTLALTQIRPFVRDCASPGSVVAADNLPACRV
ncbi:MAG: methylaspartate mutase accessory protein GlmL [Gemmatimonadota bacterium]|nr:methylaspartate mutase accessory protein GlmL [Gemmatimonadota bacterium]